MSATQSEVDMWCPYRPLYNGVIIIPIKDEDELVVGGVIMAKSVERAPTEGIVVAVGTGVDYPLPESRIEALIDAFRPNTQKGSLLWIETRCLIEETLKARPLDVKVGDRVLFPTWVCNWQRHLDSGQRWACCQVEQLLGKFEDGKEHEPLRGFIPLGH